MMRFRRVLSGLVPGLVLAAPVTAQVHEHGAEHQDSLGRVRFEVSCNAAARERFPRAVALLHSFWWEETERAFADVAAADSTCGMAYWGLAMANWRNPVGGGPIGELLRTGQAPAERAVALGARTRRERGYIAAAAALYRDAATLPSAVRLRAYSDSMEQTQRSHPGDSEAAIFYALSLVATAPATDTTFTRQRRAASILNPIFRAQPQHPGLAHYLIHANDSPRLAHLGLEAARRYARIAPAAPHAQHMPSHIFVRLGLWDEVIASNQAAYRVGAAYFEQRGLGHVATEEYHAMDYMVYAYLQEGRDSVAARIAQQADATDPAMPPASLVGPYNRAAMPARVALERGRWGDAARLTVRSTPQFPQGEMVTRFARGIGAARSGDTAQARAELAALAAIEAELTRRQDPEWPRVVAIKRGTIAAWIALAAGDTAGAVAAAAAASDLEDHTEKHPATPGELLPARELEADLLLAIGRPAAARRAYELVLAREPGRARSAYGA